MLLAQGMSLPEPRVVLGERVDSTLMPARRGGNENEPRRIHTRSGTWPQPCTRTTRSFRKRCSLPERINKGAGEVAPGAQCGVGRRLRKRSICDHKSDSADDSRHTSTLVASGCTASPRTKQQQLECVVERIVSQQCSKRLSFRPEQKLCDDSIVEDLSTQTSLVVSSNHCRSRCCLASNDVTATPDDCSVVSPRTKMAPDTLDCDGDMCSSVSDFDSKPVSSMDHACLASSSKSKVMPCLKCEFDNSLAATIEYDESAVSQIKVKSPELNGTLMPVLVKEELTRVPSKLAGHRNSSRIRNTKQRYSPSIHRLLGVNNNDKLDNMNHDKAGVYDFEPSLPNCEWTVDQKSESDKPWGASSRKVMKEARYHSKLILHHGSKVPRLRICMLVEPDDHANVDNCNQAGCDDVRVLRSPKRPCRTVPSPRTGDDACLKATPDSIHMKVAPLKRMRLKFGADSIDIPIPVGSNSTLGWG